MASTAPKSKQFLYRYGEIAWCRLKGYPEWPARVLDPDQSRHLYEKREPGLNLVIFYRGDTKPGEIAWVPDSALSDFGEKLAKKEKEAKTWKNTGLSKGLRESFEKAIIHHKRFLTADPGTSSDEDDPKPKKPPAKKAVPPPVPPATAPDDTSESQTAPPEPASATSDGPATQPTPPETKSQEPVEKAEKASENGTKPAEPSVSSTAVPGKRPADGKRGRGRPKKVQKTTE